MLPYNLESSLARLGRDTGLFQKLIRFFLEDSPILLNKVQEGLGSGAAADVERGAHSLKGLAANFSADATVEAAGKVEEFGRVGDLSAAARALPDLEAQIERLRQSLCAYLEEASSS